MQAHLLLKHSCMTMRHVAVAGARQCLQAAATTQVSGLALLQLLLAAACCGALLSRLTGRPHSCREAHVGAPDAAVNPPALATAEAAGAAEPAPKADSLHSGNSITGNSSSPTSPDVLTLGDLWLPKQHAQAGAHVLPAHAAEMSAQAQQIWRLAWHPLDRPANRAAESSRAARKSQPAMGRRLHGTAGPQTATAASSSSSGSGRTRMSPPAAGERCPLQLVSSRRLATSWWQATSHCMLLCNAGTRSLPDGMQNVPHAPLLPPVAVQGRSRAGGSGGGRGPPLLLGLRQPRQRWLPYQGQLSLQGPWRVLRESGLPRQPCGACCRAAPCCSAHSWRCRG